MTCCCCCALLPVFAVAIAPREMHKPLMVERIGQVLRKSGLRVTAPDDWWKPKLQFWRC